MSENVRDALSRAVIVESHPSFSVVRINRPAERNSLSIATLEELDKVASSLIINSDIKAIIFTGTDDVFASGADIRELRSLTSATAQEFAKRGQHLFQKIADTSQLTIAAVNGYCIGGGLDFALACKQRCASSNALFAHPGARLGIITGWGGTQRLPRLIGRSRALEMFATARRVTALEALEFGLIDAVGEPVVELARQIIHSRRDFI